MCPECIKPYLHGTNFSSLEEIRNYQKEHAKKLKLVNSKSNYNLLGFVKIKFRNDLAYSGIIIQDLCENKIIETNFKSFEPIFVKYFPSVLFLNRTDIYLDLIKDLEVVPDCYILNSGGQIHPFLHGCACDVGLKLDVPVIGYTKKLLFGKLKKKKGGFRSFWSLSRREINWPCYSKT